MKNGIQKKLLNLRVDQQMLDGPRSWRMRIGSSAATQNHSKSLEGSLR